jgi:hypothetical protein
MEIPVPRFLSETRTIRLGAILFVASIWWVLCVFLTLFDPLLGIGSAVVLAIAAYYLYVIAKVVKKEKPKKEESHKTGMED